jgi:UDP-N-acetylglucosamine 2-epimerase (non-hydrolysing)
VLATSNLTHEGVPIRKIRLTGNTVVDVVNANKRYAQQIGAKLLEKLSILPSDYLLITLHRQENTDSSSKLSNIIKAILSLSKKHKIVFPMHPRTSNRLKKLGLLAVLRKNRNVILIPPRGYLEFLGLLSNSQAVLTDSGGVQEEALTLAVPTITFRYNTERPETVLYGVNTLAGTEPESIVKLTEKQVRRSEEIQKTLKNRPNPLGDGNAGKKIVIEIKKALKDGIEVETADTRDDPYIVYQLLNPRKIGEIDGRFEIFSVHDRTGSCYTSLNNIDKNSQGKVLTRMSLTTVKKLIK